MLNWRFTGVLVVSLLGAAMISSAVKATEIKLGLEMPRGDSPEYKAAVRFKEYIEFKSDGDLTVRLFPGHYFGSARDTAEMVQQGTVEMAFPSDGAFAEFYPSIQVWSIPYMFTSAPVAWEVMNSKFARDMMEDIRATTGIRALAFSQNGFRSFTNNLREIRTPDDMAGMTIRTMESPVYMRMVEALGASPTPIAGSEVVMAVREGVVDGQENSPAIVYHVGMGDVQTYFTVNEHILGLHIIIANDEWMASLPTDQQRIIIDAAQLMAWTENLQKTEGDWRFVDLLREEKGMTVHVSTPEEKDMFKERTQEPVKAFIVEQVGADLVDQMEAAVADAEAKLYGQE